MEESYPEKVNAPRGLNDLGATLSKGSTECNETRLDWDKMGWKRIPLSGSPNDPIVIWEPDLSVILSRSGRTMSGFTVVRSIALRRERLKSLTASKAFDEGDQSFRDSMASPLSAIILISSRSTPSEISIRSGSVPALARANSKCSRVPQSQ